MSELAVSIDEMHCGACVRHVTRALEALPGIRVEQVEVGSARLLLDGDQATEQQVIGTLADAGFPAKARPAAAKGQPVAGKSCCCGG